MRILTLHFLIFFICRSKSQRFGKSLINTFPFNQQEQDGHHGEHHDGHHEAAQDVVRESKQGEDVSVSVSFDNIAASEPGDDGKRCVDKIQMVEETVYEEVLLENIWCFMLISFTKLLHLFAIPRNTV